MIVIATSSDIFSKKCHHVLSLTDALYEVDIKDLHTLELCLKKVNFNLLVLDRALLGEHGITEVASLKEHHPDLRIIVMTEHYDQREQISAILFGAHAYCDMERDIASLPKIIRAVREDELWVDRKFVTRLLTEIEDITAIRRREIRGIDKNVATLTRREEEIAEWVAKGNSNRKIADLLKISERTVKAHLGVIFKKLGVHDRLQLAIYMNHYHDIAPVWHKKPE